MIDFDSKDKPLLKTAFPSLFENLTPVAVAHGLESLDLPTSTHIRVLNTPNLVEGVLSSLIAPLDLDENAHLCISLDAEWNVSRRVGVSIIQIAPHSEPDSIYIIPASSFHLVYLKIYPNVIILLGTQIWRQAPSISSPNSY